MQWSCEKLCTAYRANGESGGIVWDRKTHEFNILGRPKSRDRGRENMIRLAAMCTFPLIVSNKQHKIFINYVLCRWVISLIIGIQDDNDTRTKRVNVYVYGLIICIFIFNVCMYGSSGKVMCDRIKVGRHTSKQTTDKKYEVILADRIVHAPHREASSVRW